MRVKFYQARRSAAIFVLMLGLLGVTRLGAYAQLIMANGSGTHCSGSFYDSGGSSGNYANSENYVYTIYPTPGTVLQVAFGSLNVETCCDYLRIHNGNSTGAPVLGTYTASPGTVISTAVDGSLTFLFHSDGSITGTGWDAVLSCVAPCAGTPNPGNTVSNNSAPCSGSSFSLTLQNGNNGVGSTYQWQSSTNGTTYTNVPSGGTGLTYTTTQTVPTYYQCIVTCSNGGATATSAPLLVGIGACINMGNGSTTTCGGTFFDSGGPSGNYANSEDYVYTIYPSPGNFLRATFSAFTLETCCDNLKIYDGNSTAAPLLGTYTGSPGVITSTAADGSLTFQFHSDGSVNPAGWIAGLSCIPNPPCAGAPAPGTATASAATVCAGVTFTIGVQNPANGSGVAYQWQSSPDGFVWSDLAGQTGTTFTGSQTQSLGYRLRAICLSGPDTGYSSVAQVNQTPFLNCYCTSGATSTVDEDIQNVTFSNINNTSPTACQTYTDYTSIVGLGFKGVTYPISVNTNDCENANFYNRRVVVYIDWNQNGLFTDPGELAFDPGFLPPAATVLFTGNIAIPMTAVSGITKMRVICVETTAAIPPCGTYTWGETEDYYLNVLPAPADEAGVLAITKPEIAACSLGDQIWVNLQNLGTNDLTQANFAVKVNGISIPVSNPWTGNVPSQGTAEVQVPMAYTLADGDSVFVEVSMPNGVAEDSLLDFNNQTGRKIWAGLTGIKTINGTPGINNYVDVDAAVTAIEQRGVCDTVYFHITTGNYNSQHTFVPYPGAGPGRLAVFESASGNAADVVFTDSNTTAATNYVFRFDAGDGYMLRNLTAVADGPTYSTVIDIRNGANDLTFEGNTFVGDTSAAYVQGDFDRIVVASAMGTDDHRTVLRNNLIQGGNRGINLGGATASYETGVVLEGNTIEKFGFLGVILGNSSAFAVNNNVFRPRTNQTQDVYSVYAVGTIDGGSVSGNDVQGNRTGASILLNNAKGSTNSLWVSNNFLYLGDTNAVAVSRGIEIQDPNSTVIALANNSISLASDNAASAGIAVINGSQIQLYNNNIGAFGSAPAVRIEQAYSISASDNNNLFGTNLGNVVSVMYTDMADLQAATSMDAASLNVNPGFTGMDLHTCAPELNGTAMALAQVSIDFDGSARSATPDIGADEFVGDANGLLSEDDFLKCPSDAITLGNAPMDGVTYAWTPSGSTSEISVTAAGTYVVTATSSCGSFSDTAVVVNKPLPVANFTASQVGLTGIFNNTSTNGTSYVWDFGDGNTSTDFGPSHVYTTGGTYSASLTVTNECGSDTHGPIPVNVFAAGIEEAQGNLEVSLFPNPTNGQFTVSMSGLANEATVLSVIDVTGKVVLTHNVPAGTHQVTLDASTFASGVYSVKISNGEFSKVIRLVRK